MVEARWRSGCWPAPRRPLHPGRGRQAFRRQPATPALALPPHLAARALDKMRPLPYVRAHPTARHHSPRPPTALAAPALDEMRALPYVRATLAESLRMYPQPPLLIRRSLAEDTLPPGLGGDPQVRALRGGFSGGAERGGGVAAWRGGTAKSSMAAGQARVLSRPRCAHADSTPCPSTTATAGSPFVPHPSPTTTAASTFLSPAPP